MIGASLKGLSEDGTHLLLVTEDGQEVRLAITDDVRALVRHARVVRAATDDHSPSLTPREIQQRIRAGLNAAELAELTGEPVEALAKFEAPVLAERAYIVDLARSTRIGKAATSPSLADLVDDRLVSRGVEPATASWDAWREVDEPWKVALDFKVAGRNVRAVWTYDHVGKALTAEDEESAWLTETELLEAPIPRRHLAAVRAEGASVTGAVRRPLLPASEPTAHVPSPADADAADPLVDEHDATQALLDDLQSKRGSRESIEVEDEPVERFEGFGPAQAAARRNEARKRDDARATTGATPQPQAPEQPADDRKPKKGRASVPSWDEIVFGTRND